MNYYELLGISIDATEEEIKSAYKKEIKKWHPDINKDEEAVSITMKLNEAKETLLNSEKRLEYDNYINHKENETYQKYTNVKVEKSNYNENNVSEEYNKYEERMVTKWEYLKEYMQQKNINLLRRIISFILVLLESFLCVLFKYTIIVVSYLCFTISDILQAFLKTIAPLLFVLLAFILYIAFNKGFNEIFINNFVEVRVLFVFGVLFISTLILPIIGKKIISQKVFDFLYNRLDIFLFKKSVGYKN